MLSIFIVLLEKFVGVWGDIKYKWKFPFALKFLLAHVRNFVPVGPIRLNYLVHAWLQSKKDPIDHLCVIIFVRLFDCSDEFKFILGRGIHERLDRPEETKVKNVEVWGLGWLCVEFKIEPRGFDGIAELFIIWADVWFGPILLNADCSSKWCNVGPFLLDGRNQFRNQQVSVHGFCHCWRLLVRRMTSSLFQRCTVVLETPKAAAVLPRVFRLSRGIFMKWSMTSEVS